MSDVGTRKVFENEDVILWEFFLEPGDKTQVHAHTRDYVFYVTAGSTLKVYDSDGVEIGEFPLSTGAVMAFKLQGDQLVVDGEERITVPATHATQNVGDAPYKEILVELKRSSSD